MEPRLPLYVKPLARVAGVFGLLQSVAWIILTSFGIASYSFCEFTQESYWNIFYLYSIIHRYYFLGETCLTHATFEGQLMTSYQVYVWSIALLILASLWFLGSASLFVYVTNKNIDNVNTALYIWNVIALAVIGVDLTMGIIFGLDFKTIGTDLNAMSEGDELFREYDALRIGTFILLTVALRGFTLELINIALVSLIFYATFEINKSLKQPEHNVHNMMPINAFVSPQAKAYDRSSSWFDNRSFYGDVSLRPKLNLPQGPTAPALRRSDSYGANASIDRRSPNMTGRPFSYLSDPPTSPSGPKPKSSASPTSASAPWNKWEGPDLPMPDYSPMAPRNLKSVLKNY